MNNKLHSEPTQEQPSAAPKLQISKGEFAGKTFNLKRKTQIGRELDNDIVLVDPKISRYHAQITLEDNRWLIADLGSSNRTYVNGQPISAPTPLGPDDRIGLGEIEVTFKMTGGPAPKTAPATPAPVEPTASPPPPAGAAAQPSRLPALPRLVWLAGAFVLLLCAAAVVTIFLASRISPGDEAGAVAAPPSAGVETGAGSEQTGLDTTGSSPPADDLVLIYEDDFSDPFGGWDDAFDAYTTKQYGNNRYQIEVSTSNLIAWGLANRDVADFELEVEARQEDGSIENSYGLLFRVQDRQNFYRFDITNDGFYLLSKFIEGEWTTLIDWNPSSAINQETNLLRVSVFGPNITISANGQELATVTDDSLSHGNFGFFASTFTDPHIWVSYDNLKLWTPDEQELALIPTATRPSAPLVDVASIETPTPVGDSLDPEPESRATTESESTEEAEAEEAAVAATETVEVAPTTEATAAPTATPIPLPEYASRSQLLARGEEAVTGRLIFPVYDSERETYDIYMADAADGGNRELIQENASQPALNQAGTELVYRSWQPDARGLFARPLDSEEAWRFDSFFESARPQFSPIDDSLMYHSRTGGREPAIYRVIDGEGVVMRREGAPIQGEAAKWSPDGRRFIYNSCLGGKCGVILSNLDGANPLLLTDHPTDTNPEISPDGSTVVFMSKRSGDWEIYRVDIDGQNLTALTSDDANDGLPIWSPEGTKIAFVANRDGKWAMWDMDPDGNNQRRLFLLQGTVDSVVQHDRVNSRGWVEENIDWRP